MRVDAVEERKGGRESGHFVEQNAQGFYIVFFAAWGVLDPILVWNGELAFGRHDYILIIIVIRPVSVEAVSPVL